jgi:hypothetical protein
MLPSSKLMDSMKPLLNPSKNSYARIWPAMGTPLIKLPIAYAQFVRDIAACDEPRYLFKTLRTIA